jgi:hypothetical protein
MLSLLKERKEVGSQAAMHCNLQPAACRPLPSWELPRSSAIFRANANKYTRENATQKFKNEMAVVGGGMGRGAACSTPTSAACMDGRTDLVPNMNTPW